MNFYAIGFVAVLGLVGLGVDYQQQSTKSELPLGQMSAQQYFNTFEARFLGAKAAKRAKEREEQRQLDWKSGGIAFLPDAPEGWTRRKYSEAINSAIMPDSVVYYEEMAKDGNAASITEDIKAKDARKKALAQDSVSWVYERGDEAVFVSLRTKNKIKSNSIGGIIGMTMGAMSSVSHRSVRGYQVVAGVGFVELPQKDNTTMAAFEVDRKDRKDRKLGGFDRAHYRRLVGTVGFDQEVIVTVHANAPIASTLEILTAIDWDGINSMLKTPMAMVGNDVVLPESMKHQQIAVEMMRQRNLFNALKRRAADFKVANMNAAALLFNEYAGGNLDVSDVAIPDLDQLIDMGFRKEMRDLIAGRPSEGEYQRIKAMIVERPKEEREVPKGEMSEELREELMGGMTPDNEHGALESPLAPKTDFAKTDGMVDPSTSKAFGTVKTPEELTTEQALYFKHTQKVAKQKGDGPAQQAARLMELERGLPPGACLVRHDTGKVACNKNADEIRSARKVTFSDKASGIKRKISKRVPPEMLKKIKESGPAAIQIALGLIERKEGLAAGSCQFDEASETVSCDLASRKTVDTASQDGTSEPVKVTRMTAKKSRAKSSGCGAGKFCKAEQ